MKKKRAAHSRQRTAKPERRPAARPRQRSNAQPPAPRAAWLPAGLPAHVADSMPIDDRLRQFLLDLSNSFVHGPALRHCRLDWGLDIKPRITKGARYDKDFAEAYELAKNIGAEFRGVLREEAADMKAIEGWEEPVFQQAKFVGWVRRYSDRMHEIMLKAGNPVKFAERHEIGGVGGKDLPSAIIMLPMGVPAPKAEE